MRLGISVAYTKGMITKRKWQSVRILYKDGVSPKVLKEQLQLSDEQFNRILSLPYGVQGPVKPYEEKHDH